MTRFRRPAVCPCAFVLATLGALAMLAGAFLDVDHPAFRFGLAVFLIGATGAVVSQKRATERGIEAVRQAAYDAGYADASEAAVPVGSNVRHLTLSRPPKEFSEQRDVGS